MSKEPRPIYAEEVNILGFDRRGHKVLSCRVENVARRVLETFWCVATVLRWCCSVHKSVPQTLKIREILGKPDFVGANFGGVRAQESVRRTNYMTLKISG